MQDAGAASGLVNVAHQLGGTLGLSVMVVVFASASGTAITGVDLLAYKLAAGYTGCLVALLLAILVTLALNILPGRMRAEPRQVTS